MSCQSLDLCAVVLCQHHLLFISSLFSLPRLHPRHAHLQSTVWKNTALRSVWTLPLSNPVLDLKPIHSSHFSTQFKILIHNQFCLNVWFNMLIILCWLHFPSPRLLAHITFQMNVVLGLSKFHVHTKQHLVHNPSVTFIFLLNLLHFNWGK